MLLIPQKVVARVELLIGMLSFALMVGLLVASSYYQAIWPHKSHALEQLAVFPAVGALCFVSGGVFLIYNIAYRYAFQPMFVILGVFGLGVPVGVFVDAYL